MRKLLELFFVGSLVLIGSSVYAEGFLGGVPVSVMKSNYGSIQVVYVGLKDPISKGNCTNGDGVVVEDSNESSEAAFTLALTAFAAGKKFECYVSGGCSHITGSMATFPVCSHYPRISN